MFRKPSLAALSLSAIASLASAQSTNFEGPPPWRDSASVYLALEPTPAPSHYATNSPEKLDQPAPLGSDVAAAAGPLQSAESKPRSSAAPTFDSSVQQALHQAPATRPAADAPRHLAPPSAGAALIPNISPQAPASRPTLDFGLPWESVATTLSALAIVIGSILICSWLVRRGNRKNASALPRDVVSVLGRVPLAARHVAQLIRVGNKLVLISLTPAGAETLTEVSDPAEVDRLVGLCQQADPHSTTKAFEQVFKQLSLEPASPGFLGKEAAFGPPVTPFEPPRGYRGETIRA